MITLIRFFAASWYVWTGCLILAVVCYFSDDTKERSVFIDKPAAWTLEEEDPDRFKISKEPSSNHESEYPTTTRQMKAVGRHLQSMMENFKEQERKYRESLER